MTVIIARMGPPMFWEPILAMVVVLFLGAGAWLVFRGRSPGIVRAVVPVAGVLILSFLVPTPMPSWEPYGQVLGTFSGSLAFNVTADPHVPVVVEGGKGTYQAGQVHMECDQVCDFAIGERPRFASAPAARVSEHAFHLEVTTSGDPAEIHDVYLFCYTPPLGFWFVHGPKDCMVCSESTYRTTPGGEGIQRLRAEQTAVC